MTKLVLEPETLPLLFPKASVAEPVCLRLIVQVLHYDHIRAALVVTRFPNLTPLVVSIDLEDNMPPPPLEMEIGVQHVLDQLGVALTSSGVAVSIIGNYDGENLTAFEVTPVDAQLLLGGQMELLAQMATLRNL